MFISCHAGLLRVNSHFIHLPGSGFWGQELLRTKIQNPVENPGLTVVFFQLLNEAVSLCSSLHLFLMRSQ